MMSLPSCISQARSCVSHKLVVVYGELNEVHSIRSIGACCHPGMLKVKFSHYQLLKRLHVNAQRRAMAAAQDVPADGTTEPVFALPADLFAVLGVARDATHSEIRQVQFLVIQVVWE